MDLENRTKAMHNKELEELKLKISEKKSRIEESNKRLADSKETQKSLIENVLFI